MKKEDIEDIELVIRIPKVDYIKISISNPSYSADFNLYYAIKNGTPLLRGHWKRMSDLPITQDDRWECSKCGNVIHCRNKINLITFFGWDARCGAKMEVEE